MTQFTAVIRAARDGVSYSFSMPPTAYSFSKGETGVMRWQSHPEKFGWYQPVVVWEGDNTKVPRRVLIIDVNSC
jgi:hypothetical protein